MATVCGRAILKKAFDDGFCRLVYVTSSYPTAEKTVQILLGLQESKAVDVVEVGVPFTDPVGDGPVIDECAQAAIRGNCTSIFTVLDVVRQAREAGFTLPVVLMGYYNTFIDGWMDKAKDIVSGVIIVDLPFEEPETHRTITELNKRDLSFVPLVTPFTSPDRIATIASIVDTFLYCTCVLGVTGVRKTLDEYLATEYQPAWKNVTENTKGKHKIIGFGVSNNQAVLAINKLGASGLVVGSALMKHITAHKDGSAAEMRAAVSSFVQELFANTRLA